MVQERLAPGGGHEAVVTQTDSSNVTVRVAQNNGTDNIWPPWSSCPLYNSTVDVTQNRSFNNVAVSQGSDGRIPPVGTQDALATITQRGGDHNDATVFQYGTGPGLTSATVEQVGRQHRRRGTGSSCPTVR